MIPYPEAMRSVHDASTNGSPDRLATVAEAAEILGITPDAVRSRLRRGTLKRSPERGEDGEVLVVMPAPKTADQSGDQSADRSGAQSATDRDASPTVALVERMASEIDWLRREVERKDTIIMQIAQANATLAARVPELEAATEPRNSTLSASEGTSNGDVPDDQERPQERRSWWRRFFGIE